MEADSVFRFVAVRPPTIKLPDLDPPSGSDPQADAVVEDRLAKARAGAANETEARREAARNVREEDALVASASGRGLLKLTGEAEKVYAKLPQRRWHEPFVTRFRNLLARLIDKDDPRSDARRGALEELRTRAWLTYYSGLLDPEREPWFEAARFWLRILHLLERVEDLPDDAPPPALAGIGLPAPAALWRIPAAPAPAPAARPVVGAEDERARDAALARGRELEDLVARLRRLGLRRRADLAARSLPAVAPLEKPSEERPDDAQERLARAPLPEVPLPADPPGDALNEHDQALLTAIGISPDATPLPRCIDGVLDRIAHLAAELNRSRSRVERQGRLYVRVDSAAGEEMI